LGPRRGGGVTAILLVRHGESEWNAAGRWQGWADIPLSATGRLQAAEAAARLASLGITCVVASDLGRTIETASIIAGILDIEGVHSEPGLREFNVGDWSGLTRPEIESRWPGQLARWAAGELAQTPGGEHRSHFLERIKAGVVNVAACHPDDTVLAISHGGVIGALQRALGDDGDKERIGNLMGRWVEVEGQSITLGALVRLLDADETTLSPTS
jgi:broad specificity phosphatase PhoE